MFGCWLLPKKFSFCPKNNGFARVWGLQPPWLVRLCPVLAVTGQWSPCNADSILYSDFLV